MSIPADLQEYMWLTANDLVTPTEPQPATFEGSKVTPLIDMKEYAEKLIAALATVGLDADPSNNEGDFIYITNWWLGLLGGAVTPPGNGFGSAGFTIADTNKFNLDPTNAGNLQLIDLLKEKSRNGVDVRVMGWVSYAIMTDTPHPALWIFPPLQSVVANLLQTSVGSIRGIAALNSQTLNALKSLRAEPKMAKKACINILGHSAGAVHVKGAVIGTKPNGAGETNAIAFTGGLDFVQDRWAEFGHEPNAAWNAAPKKPAWHDVQVAVEGPAAQGFYDYFCEMWNEIISRDPLKFRLEGDKMPSFVTGTPPVVDRDIVGSVLPTAGLTQHVQSLRTIPAFNYHWYNCLPEGEAAKFAKEGMFEVRAAWKKAILNAKRYIYFEDQGYTSTEIMEWVNEAIRNNPNLRVIFLMQGAGDPNDAPENASDIHTQVFNKALLGIGSNAAPSVLLTDTQRNQIRIYKVWGESSLVRVNGNGPIMSSTVATVDASPAAEIHVTLNNATNNTDDPLPANNVLSAFHYLEDAPQAWRLKGNPETAPGDSITFVLEKILPAPTVGQVIKFGRTYGVFTHSKVTLIDDKWAMCGSANFMRRSLYTDWEHSVSFVDDGGSGVKDLRKRLWAEHFNMPNNAVSFAQFDVLDEAIGGWASGDAAWQTTIAVPPFPTRAAGDRGPDYLQSIPLPFPNVVMSDDRRAEFDGYRDLDSREDWGGLCKP